MGCLAVLFALNEQEVEKLRSVPRKERAEYMHEEIEEIFFDKFPQYTQELDKSWDAMHRMLTDGNLSFENKCSPLCNVIFGGDPLYGITRESGEVVVPDEEDDEFMILKTPRQVEEVAEELSKLTRTACHEQYFRIDEEDYGYPLSEEDFEYTWEWLEISMDFWKNAAREKRYVLFTVDR